MANVHFTALAHRLPLRVVQGDLHRRVRVHLKANLRRRIILRQLIERLHAPDKAAGSGFQVGLVP